MKNFLSALAILSTIIFLIIMALFEIYVMIVHNTIAGFSMGAIIAIIIVSILMSLAPSFWYYKDEKLKTSK